jgi:hypothetical protein
MRKTTLLAGVAALVALTSGATLFARSSGWSARESDNAVNTVGGYTLSVNPAFATHAYLQRAGESEVELFRQYRPLLPEGRTEPPARHVVRLSGGASQRDAALTVDDPNHQIARITVEFYGPDRHSVRGPVTEKLVINGVTAPRISVDPVTCPPLC